MLCVQSGIVINFDNSEQNKPWPIAAQNFVHVTLLRGIGHEFNMADERKTISERLRSGYIALLQVNLMFVSQEYGKKIT